MSRHLWQMDHPKTDKAVITHIPGFLDKDEAQRLFQQCRDTIPWSTEEKYFHRAYYHYPGPCQAPPVVQIDILDEIARLMQIATGRGIISLFCNYYRTGLDYAGLHHDRYGHDVATLSLGGTRDCNFVPVAHGKEIKKYTLQSGDLLYFNTEADAQYKHTVPKKPNKDDQRISIVAFLV